MELQQMRYFLTVAKCEHITKAADTLHIAQPALTQCIHRIEDELSISLFDRIGRNIKLNENGRLLAKQLDPLVTAIDNVVSDFTNRSHDNDIPIRLDVRAGSNFVSEILIEYQELHKDVSFHLSQNDSNNEQDVIISTRLPSAKTTEFERVFHEEIFLAVPINSPFATRISVRLEELSNERFISFAGSRPLRAICDSLCMDAGFSPHIVFESDSPLMVMRLIDAGMGISFWPSFSWGKFSSTRAVLIPIENQDCSRNLVITPGKRALKIGPCHDFFEFIVKYMEKIAV